MPPKEDPKARAVAKVPKPPQQRGVARVPETREATSRIHLSEPGAQPVFVDDSGKRGRLLTWLSIGFALICLALIAAVSARFSSPAGTLDRSARYSFSGVPPTSRRYAGTWPTFP